MSFPKRLRHNGRGKVLATIYRRPGKSQPYRLYWRQRRAVDGKAASHSKDFRTYREAKRAGDEVVEDKAKAKAKDKNAKTLTPGQFNDAVEALKVLRDINAKREAEAIINNRKPPGDVSLLHCMLGYRDAVDRLGAKPLSEAVDGYLSTVALVKRAGRSGTCRRRGEARSAWPGRPRRRAGR